MKSHVQWIAAVLALDNRPSPPTGDGQAGELADKVLSLCELIGRIDTDAREASKELRQAIDELTNCQGAFNLLSSRV